MKKILICLAISLSMTSCMQKDKAKLIRELPKEIYTIEVEYVTGTVDTVIQILPINTDFKIRSDRGSYYLRFDALKNNFPEEGFYYDDVTGSISAVIRYNILSHEKI